MALTTDRVIQQTYITGERTGRTRKRKPTKTAKRRPSNKNDFDLFRKSVEKTVCDKNPGLVVGSTEYNAKLRDYLTQPLSSTSTKDNFVHLAAEHDLPEFIEYFALSGVNFNKVNKRHETPLMVAIANGSQKVIQKLLGYDRKARAEASKEFEELTNLAEVGDIAAKNKLKALANQPAPPRRVDIEQRDTKGMNALMHAALMGDADTLLELFDAGAKLDEQDKTDRTALAMAAEKGHIDACAVLLRLGATFSIYDNNNRNPAMLAAMGRHTDVVLLTLEAARPGNQATAAVLAKRALIKAGMNDLTPSPAPERDLWRDLNNLPEPFIVDFNIDQVDSEKNCGMTLAMIAARKGLADVLEQALNHGADFFKEDQKKISVYLHTILSNAPEADRIETAVAAVEAMKLFTIVPLCVDLKPEPGFDVSETEKFMHQRNLAVVALSFLNLLAQKPRD